MSVLLEIRQMKQEGFYADTMHQKIVGSDEVHAGNRKEIGLIGGEGISRVGGEGISLDRGK